jgi:hypothetical protein
VFATCIDQRAGSVVDVLARHLEASSGRTKLTIADPVDSFQKLTLRGPDPPQGNYQEVIAIHRLASDIEIQNH